jgi:predicted nucleic acid-binding protein
MILFDSSVLSQVFRRAAPEGRVVRAYRRLIKERAAVAIPGMVLQEVLSGVRSSKQFDSLLHVLSGFDLWLASARDHIEAALLTNRCYDYGIACSAPDALIATLAIDAKAELFTTDKDFHRIALHEPLKIFDFASYANAR